MFLVQQICFEYWMHATGPLLVNLSATSHNIVSVSIWNEHNSSNCVSAGNTVFLNPQFVFHEYAVVFT